MITLKIDVTKIDKSKLFAGKNGAKYLDLVLLESKNNAYGDDYMVVQSVSKEERESGQRGVILGNGKILGRKNPTQEEAPRSAPVQKPVSDDDVPF